MFFSFRVNRIRTQDRDLDRVFFSIKHIQSILILLISFRTAHQYASLSETLWNFSRSIELSHLLFVLERWSLSLWMSSWISLRWWSTSVCVGGPCREMWSIWWVRNSYRLTHFAYKVKLKSMFNINNWSLISYETNLNFRSQWWICLSRSNWNGSTRSLHKTRSSDWLSQILCLYRRSCKTLW